MEMLLLVEKGSSELQWSLGSCSGIQHYPQDFTRYEYRERCCLQPGTYTLTCQNNKQPEGWNNGFIELQGKRYCDDFIGLKALRKVEIVGK